MLPEMFTVNHAQQHTQSSWDHTKYPILSKMSLRNTVLYQPSELGAWIQNNPDRFAQIHKTTMLGLLWYNNTCSKTRLDYPKTRKGDNTAGRKAIRCYLATFLTAGATQVLQLKLKAMENLEAGWHRHGTNVESWSFAATVLKYAGQCTKCLCPLRSEIKYNLAFTWGICLIRHLLPSIWFFDFLIFQKWKRLRDFFN